MSDTKQLAFEIKILGATTESDEMSKLTKSLQDLYKAKQDIIQSYQKGLTTEKEAVTQLAANSKEISGQTKLYSELSNGVKIAGDSLTMMRAKLSNLKNEYANGSAALRTQLIPQISALNTKILESETAIGTHQRNVGNYPQLFSMIPGPVGQAANSISMFSSTLAGVNPVFLAIGAGIVGAIGAITAPMIAFLKWSQDGMDILAQKTNGWKAAITVLKGELVDAGQKMSEGPAAEKNYNRLQSMIEATKQFFTVLTGGLFKNINELTGTTAAWNSLKGTMNDAAKSAELYTKTNQELEAEENAMIVVRANANLELKKARLAYSDINLSLEERLDALKKAIALENKTTDQEIALNSKRAANELTNIDRLKAAHQDTRAEEKIYQELIARGIDLRTDSYGREIRNAMRVNTLQKEITADEFKVIAEFEKMDELQAKMDINSTMSQKTSLKNTYDEQLLQLGHSYDEREQMRKDYEAKDAALDAQMIQKQKDVLKEQMDLQLKHIDTIIQPEYLANAQRLVIKKTYDEAYAQLDEKAKAEQEKRDLAENTRENKVFASDLKAMDEARKLAIDNQKIGQFSNLKALNDLLDAQHTAMIHTVEWESMTDAQKLVIEQQYNKAKRDLSVQRITDINSELQVVADAFGAMADLLGKNTIIGKAMAIAQATINTWAAASIALKAYPPPFSFIAMAAAITAGLATVANIVKVQVPSQTASSSVSKYAGGGLIKGGLQIHSDTSKDNTLVYVQQGETILNQRQIAMLGGSGVMAAIKIPGYAGGGYTGSQTPHIAPAGFNMNEFHALVNSINARADATNSRIDRIEVIQYTDKIRRSLNEVEVNNQTQRI